MAVKVKSRRKKKPERQKHWDVCDADCSHCWPKVYQHCKSPKRVNKALAILEDMQERAEKELDIIVFLKKIEKKGYVEGN